MLRNNSNGIFTDITKDSRVFAIQCAQGFTDSSITIRSDVVLSSYKVKIKQHLLDKALAKHFTEQLLRPFDINNSFYWIPINWSVLQIDWWFLFGWVHWHLMGWRLIQWHVLLDVLFSSFNWKPVNWFVLQIGSFFSIWVGNWRLGVIL